MQPRSAIQPQILQRLMYGTISPRCRLHNMVDREENTVRVVFGKQLTFDFDNQDRKSSQHLIACVDRHNAEGQNILLAELAGVESRPPGVSREKSLQLIADLIRDDQILFEAGGKCFDKIASLAVFNQPERWLAVAVVRAPVVDPAVLTRTRQAIETIFNAVVPHNQNALCRWVRQKLAAWKDETESFRCLARTVDYPGKADMTAILTTAGQLLDIYDPLLFMQALNSRTERLATLARRYDGLHSFYGRRGHIWQALTAAMADFEENASRLDKDPRSAEMFRYLKALFHSRRPFATSPSLMESIDRVKAIDRQITAQRTREAAAAARRGIEGMLVELRQTLHQAQADSHLCNRILYPLQRLRRRLDTAPTTTAVADLVEKARDLFDSGRDQIESR